MTLYDRLFAQRDTFCDGGIAGTDFARSYFQQAEKLVNKLRGQVK